VFLVIPNAGVARSRTCGTLDDKMTSGTQPSRVLLIAAGVLTQLTGAVCLVLALAALPIAHDLRSGTTGVVATAVAALAALVCGPLIWRGRLVPLALAAGIDLGLAIGLPRGGSAIGALLRILPADELHAAEPSSASRRSSCSRPPLSA
jgi:hypothetical protein